MGKSKGDGGHNEMAEMRAHPLREWRPPRGREDLEHNGKKQQHDNAKKEIRGGNPDESSGHGRIIDPGILAHGSHNARRQGDRDGHAQGSDNQFNGHWQIPQHIFEDRATVQNRRSPITLYKFPEPGHILYEKRPVKTVFLPQ